MLCPKCSALIDDDSIYCSKCGITVKEAAVQPVIRQETQVSRPEPQEPGQPDPVVQYVRAQEAQQPPIPPAPEIASMSTYLTQNILLTVFSVICCMTFALPTAITGLVFSAVAQGALKQNDLEKAKQYVKLAKIFMWITFGIEIATVVFTVLALALNASIWSNMWGNIFRNGSGNFDFDQFEQFQDQLWQ